MSKTKLIFQDSPGPENFREKIQDFTEFSRRDGNSGKTFFLQKIFHNFELAQTGNITRERQ